MADDREKEGEVVLAQFKRNLSHILGTGVKGPEITVGDTVLTFKAKAPVTALADLIGNENRVNGMKAYIRQTLVPGQEEAFESLLELIDIEGLSEILNVLSEGYSSFPEK